MLCEPGRAARRVELLAELAAGARRRLAAEAPLCVPLTQQLRG